MKRTLGLGLETLSCLYKERGGLVLVVCQDAAVSSLLKELRGLDDCWFHVPSHVRHVFRGAFLLFSGSWQRRGERRGERALNERSLAIFMQFAAEA